MAATKKCPRCGAEIPEDAPGGACPQCALRDALGLGAYDAKNVDQSADTVPMHIDERERSRITQTIQFQRRLRKILFASRWFVAGFFFFLVGYVLVRHVWMSNHIRPNVYLDDNLQIKFESDQLGLSEQSRLVRVNGRAVNSMEDVYASYDSERKPVVAYEFTDGTGPGRTGATLPIVAVKVRQPFLYSVNSSGVLTVNESNALLMEALTDDERIVAVNRYPLDEITTNGPASRVPLHPIREIAGYTTFTVQRESDGAERLILTWMDTALEQRGRMLGGIGFLGIGLLVFWLRPDTRASAGFLSFCFVLGGFYLARSISIPYRLPVENSFYYLFQGLVPAVSAIFLITFTPLRALTRRAGIAAFLLLFAALVFLGLNSLTNPRTAEVGLLSMRLFRTWAFVILILFLIALPMDWWLRLLGRPVSPTDKERARTLRIALVLGLAPTVLFATRWITPAPARWVHLTPLVDVSVLVFPALLGYAIVRHNFLRLNELARESVLYGFLMAVLTGFYVAGTSVIVPLAQQYLPAASQWSQSVVLAGAMAAIIPIHTATRKAIEKRLKRVPFEFEHFLIAVDQEESKWHGPVDYCHTIASQLSRMVDTAHITVLTHYPNEVDWSISASIQPSKSDDADSCKMLCALLEQERSDVFRDDVLEGFRYRIIQREILDGLEALDAALVIPLISRGHVVGAISLGDKSGNMNYSAAELITLKRIASHAAGTLYNLMSLSSISSGTRICDIWPDCPERIGGYDIEGVLGEGGMAYVFHGRRNGKPFAIKVANRLVQSNSRLMERFHREASAIQRLNHPNIVKIVEVGWEGSEPFIVFEYFENGSLDQMVNSEDPLDIPSVVQYGIQIAKALQYAHDQGIIHRDIKPRNVFLDDDFNAKVGDFGLAQIADRSTITQKGEFLGTPDYLAPELLRGSQSSVRSDIYALGVTLFELCAGRRPFVGETAQSVLYQAMNDTASSLSDVRSDVPTELAACVERMLLENPGDRVGDYGEVICRLNRCLPPNQPIGSGPHTRTSK